MVLRLFLFIAGTWRLAAATDCLNPTEGSASCLYEESAFLQRPISPLVLSQGSLDSPLPLLPRELVEEMFWASIDWGWYTSNTWADSKGNAAQDYNRATQHMSRVRFYAKGILSDETVNTLQELMQLQGWYAAEENNKSEQTKTGSRANAALHHLKQIGEMTDELCDNIHKMFEYAGWWTSVALWAGETQETKADYANAVKFKVKITGEVVMKDLQIHSDNAEMSQGAPKSIGRDTFENIGDTSATQKRTFAHTDGQTSTWDNNVNFEVGITETLEASAEFLGAGGKETTTFSFSASYAHSWGGSSMDTTTTSEEFSVTVPPHSTYALEVTVWEAKVVADYTMVLSISGHDFKKTGKWHGIASTRAFAKSGPVEAFGKSSPVANPA